MHLFAKFNLLKRLNTKCIYQLFNFFQSLKLVVSFQKQFLSLFLKIVYFMKYNLSKLLFF